ncbi:uncharacterized protein LOC133779352 [Humulus lupulus]|uniref:uncharacterized protein LOC133779352 n=1 Tax=Humulus lupulus TaxID=3486 RepID=UPI002B409D0A|nr:uncharacterized protein LOC133779352 [Humulus lupulus]
MPSYVKFMKEILSNKSKIKDYETVALTEECSAIIQKKLPQKLRDLGSFTIPCSTGNFHCKRALCDLGASINLIPLSVFRRLGLGEARPTTITLQLVGRSLTHPHGIIEDVLVKVEKCIFPTDFIVLDMEEDEDVPIILGRPFLATSQALIDVQKGELRLRVQGDEVVFNVFQALKYPRASDSCFSVNVIEEQLSKRQRVEDPLEMSLIAQGGEDWDGIEVMEYVNWLNSARPIYKKKYEELGQGPERPLPSMKKPLALELKTLLDHLKYAYLGKNDTLPVIISASLSTVEEEKLLREDLANLRSNQENVAETMALQQREIDHQRQELNERGQQHHILMEEDSKASIDAERRLNPAMKEVVRKEILKWLDAGVIYPISDSSWMGILVVTKYLLLPKIKRKQLLLVLMRCKESNLVMNWKKCHFMVSEGIVLGYKISSKGIEVDSRKVSTIENLPPQISFKGVQSFLGHAGFYKRFIKDFSKISKPLSALLMNEVQLNFDVDCQRAFNTLKEKLITAPIVAPPNWELPFE